jgi:hypothetical protein
MNMLRHLWFWLRYRRPLPSWTGEQRRAFDQLGQLVRVYHVNDDSPVGRDFKRFSQEIEHDRCERRKRRQT